MNNDVTEQDLMLLESYLDDELSVEQSNALRRRLAQEPRLSAELARLKADRSVRQAVWAAMEPDDAVVFQLKGSVHDATDRHLRRSSMLLRIGKLAGALTAAAACVLLGVSLAQFQPPSVPQQSSPQGPKIAVADNADQIDDEPQRQIDFSGPQNVAITDRNGRIIAIQPFRSPTEAKQFLDDVGVRQPAPRAPSGAVPVNADQF